MQTRVPHPPAADKTRPVRWSTWIVPFFVGALVVAAVGAVASDVVGAGWNLPRPLFWLGLGVIAAVITLVMAACHPIRGRSDATHLWKGRFPAQTEQDIQRFLQTVGKSLGYRAQDWSKLGPDDDLSTLHHRWSGGDGMELIELLMTVEREYGLALPEEFLSTDKTLGELFDHVMRSVAGPSVPNNTGLTRREE